MWFECQRPVELTGILTTNQTQHDDGARLERKAGACKPYHACLDLILKTIPISRQD